MYPMHKIGRAFDRRDPADKITDILLQKQLEQIDKAQKSFVREMTAQQNLSKRRFDDKMMRTENGYAKLWESRNMTNIWLQLNQDMGWSCSPTGSMGGRKSSQKKPKSLLARGKTVMETSSTGGDNKAEDSTAPQTTDTEAVAPSERVELWRSNNGGHRPKLQRNVTFVNSRTLHTDLGDNLKVTPIRPSGSGLKASECSSPGKVESWRSSHSGTGKHRRQNYHLQSNCWGSKFFSNRRTPRQHNESRRYSKVGSPTKHFLGGVDISECFANISLNRNSDNYESKIKDFCDSLKHLILTSTNEN